MTKKLLLVLLVIVGLLVLDLYTFELILQDPGYYVVAHRSDNPRQVIRALKKIDTEKVSNNQWKILLNRYRKKARNDDFRSVDRKKWSKAHEQVKKLIETVN